MTDIRKAITDEHSGRKAILNTFGFLPVSFLKPKYDIIKETRQEITVPSGAQIIPKLVNLMSKPVNNILPTDPNVIDRTGILTFPVASIALFIPAVMPSKITLGEITERSINPSITLPDSNIIPSKCDG